MYAAKGEQIRIRFAYIERIVLGCEQLAELEKTTTWLAIHQFAQERLMHLAIETVTDIGSLLIDAFELREASSYEDIVAIMRSDEVCDAELSNALMQLVKCRKSLVQDYMLAERTDMHPTVLALPSWLRQFRTSVEHFIEKENVRWGYPRLG